MRCSCRPSTVWLLPTALKHPFGVRHVPSTFSMGMALVWPCFAPARLPHAPVPSASLAPSPSDALGAQHWVCVSSKAYPKSF